MSHGVSLNININEVMEAEPIQPSAGLSKAFWTLFLLGAVVFFVGVFKEPNHTWAVYYVNAIFWMGLAAGSIVIPAILQIVRAEWSTPIRRLAEANIAYLPWAFILFLGSYFGMHNLFTWAQKPMAGREFWMQPGFVYIRFAILFMALFGLLWRFVYLSLRSDIGFLREKSKNRSRWEGWPYTWLSSSWGGSSTEPVEIQRKLSWYAPLVIVVYVVVYSLYAFEMVMGMNETWYSNMYGGFTFVGNIYAAWAMLSILVAYSLARSPAYAKTITTNQLWDLGKLMFGFCMLWGYLFFSQFLPQWYGNLPEETQWMILRTREYPWKSFGWITFPLCFIIPFILLVSEDLKRRPRLLAAVGLIICSGIWCEKYITVMPEISPESIPFGFLEVGVTLGFIGLYGLSITGFLRKYPFIPVSSPLTKGDSSW